MAPRHWLLAVLPLVASCGFIDLSLDGDGLNIAFESEEIPLLPAGFPVYPKAFSTASLGLAIEEAILNVTFQEAIDAVAGDICAFGFCLTDLLSNADYDTLDDALFDEIPEVQDWLEQFVVGRLNFYNPGPSPSASVSSSAEPFKGPSPSTTWSFTSPSATAPMRCGPCPSRSRSTWANPKT